MLRLPARLTLSSLFLVTPLGAQAQAPTPATTFTLDGVQVSLRSSFLPTAAFHTAAPGDGLQVASAVVLRPFQEISVTAVPFGRQAGTEDLPVAHRDGAASYREGLSAHRMRQGGTPRPGPAIRLFAQEVVGSASVVALAIGGATAKPVLIVEWVVEAGPRLWIVRASRELSDAAPAAWSFASLEDLTLTSGTLDRPTTVGSTLVTGAVLVPDASEPPEALADLPVPYWWNGDCDYNHYLAGSGMGSFRLGTQIGQPAAVFRGVPACGPRPDYDTAPNVSASGFPVFPGTNQPLEWQCPELSKRYLYLALGCPAYSANGNQVVDNYPAACPPLQKVANGTPNAAPQAGDVLSYSLTSPYGHTAVVTSASVDANGNGSITVIEQNNSQAGRQTHTVTNWHVNSSLNAFKWLHAAGLVTADGTTVYWVQNGKKYHVFSDSVLTAMESAGVPGWSWATIGTVTPTQLAAWTAGPELVTPSCSAPDGTACPSDGLLLRQYGGTQVFVVERGVRRWITSGDALNGFGGNWFPDVIDVAPAILAAPHMSAVGNSIYGVGEGESNASIKAAMKAAYDANAADARCLRPTGWLGWPGTAFSRCLGFPSGLVGTASSGASSLTGRYQNGAAETGLNKGAIEYSSLGAYAVHGAIYSKYRDLGYTASPLGFPTSNEFWSGSLRRSNFEGGFVTWDPATNQTAVTYSGGQNPTVQLTSPNGGESWTPGSVRQITWTSSGVSASASLHVYYWHNGTWNTVATLAGNATSYAWTVPNTPTTSTRVFVGYNWQGSAWQAYDQSDQTFSIAAGGAAVQLTSPNGGESWTIGSVRQITWSGSGLSAGASVHLFYWQGGAWHGIATLPATDSSYAWTVPNAPTTSASVFIGYNWQGSAWQAYDQSDQVFAIW